MLCPPPHESGHGDAHGDHDRRGHAYCHAGRRVGPANDRHGRRQRHVPRVLVDATVQSAMGCEGEAESMKTIKLMADYECWPLWCGPAHDPGNINPSTLPLTGETRDRLRRWADAYDATLDPDDPASSDFPSDATREAFEEEGVQLWHTLQVELGADYLVLYQDIIDWLPRHPDSQVH